MLERFGARIGAPLLLALVPGCAISPSSRQTRDPIIDMHLHAHTLSMYGSPPPAVCTNDQPILFPGFDPKDRLTADRVKWCPAPVAAPGTDEELLRAMLDRLGRYNIRAVTSGPLEEVGKWREAAPDREPQMERA